MAGGSRFCPQTRPDSCVAACSAMLLHHHAACPGQDILGTHDRLHREFAPPPLPTLEDAARSIGARFEGLDPDDDPSFAMLEAVVASTWCAVVVMGGVWTHG